MPRLTKSQLLDVIVRSIHRCGWQVAYLSDDHPFRLLVYHQDESYRLRVYIWNLTHGGGSARPADEYRVQITGMRTQQFEPEPEA